MPTIATRLSLNLLSDWLLLASAGVLVVPPSGMKHLSLKIVDALRSRGTFGVLIGPIAITTKRARRSSPRSVAMRHRLIDSSQLSSVTQV